MFSIPFLFCADEHLRKSVYVLFCTISTVNKTYNTIQYNFPFMLSQERFLQTFQAAFGHSKG